MRVKVPRVPKLFLHDRQSTSIPTHELLIKLGFLTTPKPGLNHWLPPGLLMVNKLRSIIATTLNDYGCQEVSLLILSSSENWEKTGRWNNTELFKLNDTNNQQYCLSPTSEEEITNVVKHQITSYKDLPIIYYQIHEKFRDEIRPRMGLLRSREFLMKDAYSFDIDQDHAMKSYDNMVSAYHTIFSKLKVPYYKADADSGDIGGDLSHEWHYLSPHGEDTLFKCDGCGSISNVEKTVALPVNHEPLIDDVDELYFNDDGKIIKVIVPKSRQFELNFLKNYYPNITAIEYRGQPIDDTIYDIRCDAKGYPLVLANHGELCSNCSSPLQSMKAIEIGHTFYLGSKYSKPLDLSIPVPIEGGNGKTEAKHVMMGCYGIGISRIIAALGDLKDSKGFKWPVAIAPWQVTVISLNKSLPSLEEIIHGTLDATIDYRWDDRDINLSSKIRQSNLLGIPIIIIIGKHYPMIEVEPRWEVEHEALLTLGEKTNNKWLVHKDNLNQFLTQLLSIM